MKTQVNKTLHFKKGTITELNDKNLMKINGGTISIILVTDKSTDTDCQVDVRSISWVDTVNG